MMVILTKKPGHGHIFVAKFDDFHVMKDLSLSENGLVAYGVIL